MTFLTRLARAWELTKAAFGLADETRPDPEDAKARDHAVKIEAAQKELAFPMQWLRGGVIPSDRKAEEGQGWEPPPTGYESWVDVYEGPLGTGFVANYEVRRGSKLFRKAMNVGPEVYREQDWTEVVPVPVEGPR